MRQSLVRRLLQQASREFSRFHSEGRVVRTSVNAAWLRKARTKVAGRCLLLDHRFFLALGIGQIRRHVERMHVDIAVRAIFSTEAAADAPIFDDHFQRIPAANRSHQGNRPCKGDLGTGGRKWRPSNGRSEVLHARAASLRRERPRRRARTRRIECSYSSPAAASSALPSNPV
jgi:hypothetical protein